MRCAAVELQHIPYCSRGSACRGFWKSAGARAIEKPQPPETAHREAPKTARHCHICSVCASRCETVSSFRLEAWGTHGSFIQLRVSRGELWRVGPKRWFRTYSGLVPTRSSRVAGFHACRCLEAEFGPCGIRGNPLPPPPPARSAQGHGMFGRVGLGLPGLTAGAAHSAQVPPVFRQPKKVSIERPCRPTFGACFFDHARSPKG